MYLSHDTVARLVDLTMSVAAARDRAEVVAVTLAGLDRLVGADTISLNDVDPLTGLPHVTEHPAPTGDPAGLARFAELLHEHPLVSHFTRHPGDGPA